jgi:glycosyltransferase involved in cell wall biosynthesis
VNFMSGGERLRIVHVARAPVGGVLRHILDLATAQAAAGHAVGIVCDSTTGGAFEDKLIGGIADKLALGVTRLRMRRQVSLSDLIAARQVLGRIGELEPDIVHGHGAKGGAYGRLIGTLIGSWVGRARPVGRLYAPHGGSLHYDKNSTQGRVYFGVERLLERITDAIVHVSAYEAETYRHKIGTPRCRAQVVPNGLRPEEYDPVTPRADARDLLFLGTFRELKGIDIFLSAIAEIEKTSGKRISAHLVGQPDELPRYHEQARSLGLLDRVTFHDPKPPREAFTMARAIVVPSRAESMPYVVLEAIAAGMPIIATRVGGIPEIFGPRADELVPAGDPSALAVAIAALLADPDRTAKDAAARREWLRPRFSIDAMRQTIDTLYRDVLRDKAPQPQRQVFTQT